MNLLVSKFYNLNSHTNWYTDRSSEHNMVNNYSEMIKNVCDSARDYLKDLDDVLVHTGDVDDIRTAFVQHHFAIKELWDQGHNILYVDADCVFVKPTSIFGKYDKFMLFNHTQPSSLHTDKYNFPHYFNCGIRYYPQTMDPVLWEIGDTAFENMDRTHWDEEQRIYNKMFWYQQIPLHQAHQPHQAYQLLSGLPGHPMDDNHNGISIQDANIIHLHGSRGSADRLKTQIQLMEQL